MMDRLPSDRMSLVAIVLLAGAAAIVRADEPVQAPPAPTVTAADEQLPAQTSDTAAAGPSLLAPAAVDAADNIVPAGRRDGARRGAQGVLAPESIGDSQPVYVPGDVGGQIYPSTPQVLNIPEGAQIMTVPEGAYTYGGYYPDEATVRISDRPAEQVGATPPGVRPSNRICPECRFCKHGVPYHQCPECEPSDQMVRQYRRRHGVIYPPDYGWSPPGKHPIDRISIDYYRAFPAAWNGQQPRTPAVVRPSVYWPTDTTQLGYTYQHGPRWMPYPGMVPPVPHPAQWHQPLCNAYGTGGMNGPCPHCRGNAVEYPEGGASPQPQAEPLEDAWTPTDVTQAPTGPALNAASVPALTPAPF